MVGYMQGMELPELAPRHICADYLQGLIHVVPKHGAGDDAGNTALAASRSSCTQAF